MIYNVYVIVSDVTMYLINICIMPLIPGSYIEFSQLTVSALSPLQLGSQQTLQAVFLEALIWADVSVGRPQRENLVMR